MLSDHERRVLEELERTLTAEAESPEAQAGGRDAADGSQDPGTRGRDVRAATDAGRAHPPIPALRRWDRHRPAGRAVVVAGWLSLLLLVTGAEEAAVALVLAAGLAWSLWRFWPQLRDDGSTAALPASDRDRQPGSAARRAGAEWLSRYLKRISEVE